jgi:hypothetical protein
MLSKSVRKRIHRQRILRRWRLPLGLYRAPRLTINQILAWADDWFARRGKWPFSNSGVIPGTLGDTWARVETALRKGHRGLPGKQSLGRLLAERRNAQRTFLAGELTEEDILEWADNWKERTGDWPYARSGSLPGRRAETWKKIDSALRLGLRGLRGGSSLAQFLYRERSVERMQLRPRLTISQIFSWADKHKRRTGNWPTSESGVLADAPRENWRIIDDALRSGRRGLRGGSSLAQLLAKGRGVRNLAQLTPYRLEQILRWVDAWHKHTGRWPHKYSGAIPQAPGETWMAVDAALHYGHRGLPGGSSLVRLLAKYHGVPNPKALPRFSISKILRWANAHHARTGRWPSGRTGHVTESPRDSWKAIDYALAEGYRGVGPGKTLALVLSEHRGVRNRRRLPPLTIRQILRWVQAHRRRTGRWPTAQSGLIPDSGGESWLALHHALVSGRRGLDRRMTLAQFLAAHYPDFPFRELPDLTINEILRWAKAHKHRTGRWPTVRSGKIPESPGDSWHKVDGALINGRRGVGPGCTLAELLAAPDAVCRSLAKRRPPRATARRGKGLPKLTISQILKWGDPYHRRTGRWPEPRSGPIEHSDGETWAGVSSALYKGRRGVGPHLTLPRLFALYRDERKKRPLLSLPQILEWARSYRERKGRWPRPRANVIAGSGGETWVGVDQALRHGRRGLPAGWSLATLIAEHDNGASSRNMAQVF